MPLPVIQYPVHEVYLKSLDRKIKFRPFLVKEEKIMLIAKESGDDDGETLLNAVKQIITNCCLEEIDVDKLPVFDVQMFFIHLRMRSIGEKIDLGFKCTRNLPDSEEICNTQNEYLLSLDSIDYTIPENTSDVVQLSEEIGIKLRYPVLNKIGTLFKDAREPLTVSMNLISENVVYIYDKDQVYNNSQFTKEELMEFLSNLSQEHLDKIMDFFLTIPRVMIKDRVNCIKCGAEHDVYAEDIAHFFI